ncbi:MAG TPA: carboxypeptidase-like regulatory domain-containing protein [Ktedonobacterales bacterium]|jgi:hypothetical protein|nr:carboxypeptidase-like regulatory domain-containing protein [Ktedonobacterales bacterium]
MRKFAFAFVTALGLAYCALVAAPMAAAHPGADGQGSITGKVVNGTHDNALVASLTVTLQDTVGTRAKDAATAKTDAQGRFSFTGLDLSGVDLYSVYTHFQGGLYSTQPVQFGDSTTQQVSLTVFDAAANDANLSIKVTTLLVREPLQRNGLIGIGEFVTFTNTGKTAFVGQTTPVNNDPHTLLRFALPPGATNVTLGVGFANAQATSAATGFSATATVPPGDTKFAFAYNVPYRGMEYTLPYKTVYSTQQVIALVPPDMFVDSGSYTVQGLVDSFGSRYQVFYVNDLKSSAQANLHLWNLPKAGEPSYLDSHGLVILTGGLALAIALLLFLYLRRGELALVFGLVPADALQAALPKPKGAAGFSDEERKARHKRLLQDLLDLEQARDEDKLSEALYRRRAGDKRRQLRLLLAGEPDTTATTKSSATASREGKVLESEPPSDPAQAAQSALKGGKR